MKAVWPDVERDRHECVKHDDVREERHDGDDGRSAGHLWLPTAVVVVDYTSRYEVLPGQNLLEPGTVRVLPQTRTDGADKTQTDEKQKYLQCTTNSGHNRINGQTFFTIYGLCEETSGLAL